MSSTAAQLVDPAGRPLKLGYDAAEDKKRRLPPRTILRSEDKELDSSKRRKVVATGRDVVRNFEIACWAIRKHLDYVASFHFQSRSGNAAFDRRLEELVAWWARPLNFDVAGRHGMNRFLRMIETRRTLDGDVFPLKLADGKLQGIEGDRIRTPTGGRFPFEVDLAAVTHGVVTNKAGRATGYCLHNRVNGTNFEFDRVVPARYLIQHGYWDTGRFDQVRGVGLITPGINRLQDCYENLEYASAKSKISQMFGIALTQSPDREDSAGDVTTSDDDDGNLDKSATEVDFGQAPYILDLMMDEKAEVLESRQPAMEWQKFMELVILVGIKSLDIPYSFFSEKYTNYSGQRQAWIQYDISAEAKRQENRELLNALLAWRIMLWVVDGVLQLPKSMTIGQLAWEFIGRGIPWIQPLQEIKADKEAIAGGLGSTPRTAKARGLDAYELVDEEAEYQEYRQQKLGKYLAAGDRGANEPADQPA